MKQGDGIERILNAANSLQGEIPSGVVMKQEVTTYGSDTGNPTTLYNLYLEQFIADTDMDALLNHVNSVVELAFSEQTEL